MDSLSTLMDHFLWKIGGHFYPLNKKLQMRRWEREDESHDHSPLLVYQMGKVGSTSIYRSLRMLDLNHGNHHVHFLTNDTLSEFERRRKPLFKTEKHRLIRKVWESQYVSNLIKRNKWNEKWNVITLVRDPIARNLSSFFHNLRPTKLASGKYNITSEWYEYELTISLDEIQALVDIFFEKFDHEMPLEYFDREIKTVLDIDVFDRPFPTTQGFQIYENDRARLLLIRLEDLNACAMEAVKAFLGIDDFRLEKGNVGQNKGYAELYGVFKEKIVFPDAYLTEMYGSRFARCFYSDAEIARFKDKWQASAKRLSRIVV